MRKLFAASILILTFCVVSFAQTNQTAPCPTISVTGPPGIPEPNKLVTFTAEISKEAEKFNTILQWTVNNGELIEGQGNNQIKVLWKDMCEKNLTATIEVFGLPKNCQNTATETASVTCCFTQLIIIDEFSFTADQIDKAKLGNLAKESQNNPNAQIYIIEMFAKNTSSKIIEQKNQKTLDYLKTQGIERERITLLNAFDKESITQFILVPLGASSPTCDECVTVQPN